MTPRLTVIPPGPVTPGARIEVRAATDDGRAVTFTCDGMPFEAATPSIPYARAWWTPSAAGRYSIAASSGGSEAEPWSVDVLDTGTRAVPMLSGGWLDPGSFGPQGYARDGAVSQGLVRDTVDAMAGLGMTTIVITYVEWNGTVYYPSELELYDRDLGRVVRAGSFGFDLVESVLSQADAHGMHVFLGLGRHGDLMLLWEFDEPGWAERNEASVAHATAVARELWTLYGHHPSFYGWYLSHEMNDLARAGAYYDRVAAACRELAPEKPVLAAPSGTPIIGPEILRASEVDIFAHQDAVGAGYVPYEYTWDPAKRIATLDEVYASYERAHEGTDKHFWVDLETWEMDGTLGYRGSYAPSFERVRQQIEIASRYTTFITGYEYSGFFQHPGGAVSLTDPRARALYDDYATYLKGIR